MIKIASVWPVKGKRNGWSNIYEIGYNCYGFTFSFHFLANSNCEGEVMFYEINQVGGILFLRVKFIVQWREERKVKIIWKLGNH